MRTTVNIGPDTEPKTFVFARNWWWCADASKASRPSLPAAETDGVVGRDPGLVDPDGGDLGVREGSPARDVGAHAARTE